MIGTRVLVRTLWRDSLLVPVGIALGGALLVGLAARPSLQRTCLLQAGIRHCNLVKNKVKTK